jgi:hypothetical protein
VKFELDSLKGSDSQEDVRVDGRPVLKRNLKKCGVRVWTEYNWLRM